MRFTSTFLAIGFLALAPGAAIADEPDKTRGSDWDDSHMQSRHATPLPIETRFAGDEEVLAPVIIGPRGERTLPGSEYRGWDSAPISPSVVHRRKTASPDLAPPTVHGNSSPTTRSKNRATSQPRRTRSVRSSR